MGDELFRSFSELMRQRRSVRQFKHEPVDPAVVESVLETVRFSPTPTNRLCYRFLGINEPLLLQAMRQAVLTRVEEVAARLDDSAAEEFRRYSRWFTFFDQAPMMLIGMYRLFVSRLPAGDPKDNPPEGMAEMQAFGGAVHACLLGLQAKGLGACWMSGPLLAEERLIHLLRVERPWRLGAVIPVGWPETQPAMPKKPELEGVLTWQK